MSRASIAYDSLTAAMETTTPDCAGNDLFTADDLTKPDIEACAAICDTCPLFDLCRTYAEIERPKGGVWAGKTYRNYKTKESNK